MKLLFRTLAFTAVCVTIFSCNPAKRIAQSTPEPEPVVKEKRVVGYIPSWSYNCLETLDWDALTHVNIAFCNPDTLGNMQNPFTNALVLDRIVALAHNNDVKVIASLGGGGGGKNYPALIQTPQGREDFCKKIVAFAREYDLDGVDLDLEEGRGHILWQNYEAWVKELRRQCSEGDLLLTTAVSTWFSDDISDATFDCFDFVNIMAYDGPFESHSTMDLAETMARSYAARGIEPARIVIGVPFYGYPHDGTWGDSKSYAELLALYPEAWAVDKVDKFGYNGMETMKAKTELGKRYGGIMIWHLDHDTQDEHSLLKVIKDNL